jgi:hypothetical protein
MRAIDPPSFSFSHDRMSVEITAGHVSRLIPYIQEYLRDGNNTYRTDKQIQKKLREEEERKRIEREIADERARQEVIRVARGLI